MHSTEMLQCEVFYFHVDALEILVFSSLNLIFFLFDELQKKPVWLVFIIDHALVVKSL